MRSQQWLIQTKTKMAAVITGFLILT